MDNKWLGRRLFDNWDLSNALLNHVNGVIALIFFMLGFAATVMTISGWPYKLQPNSVINNCPLILNSDSDQVANQKIAMCKIWYSTQYH